MRNKSKAPPKIVWYIYLAAILALLMWISVTGRNSYRSAYQLRQKVEKLEAETSHLRAVNDSLSKENERLKTDPETAEKAAREQYGLTKPNEKVFRFVPAKEDE